jgi:VIT1/CCC1 family predicted Fe2+/Mn2+ transporter
VLAQAILVAMIVLGCFGALATISQIGKPRKPITPGVAIAVVVYNTAFIAGLVHIYFRR